MHDSDELIDRALLEISYVDQVSRRHFSLLNRTRDQKRYAGISFQCGGVDYPYPGHVKLFVNALRDAHRAAVKAGGLSQFGVYSYRFGEMELVYELQGEHPEAENRVSRLVREARRLSRKTCALFGEAARRSRRFQPHDASVAFCGAKVHSDVMIETLLNYSL